MSNHLHVVVQTLPEAATAWKADEIAARWIRLFPRQDQDLEVRTEVLSGNPERIAALRERLADLSWFIRCLSEPIAKRGESRGLVQGPILGGPFQVPGVAG